MQNPDEPTKTYKNLNLQELFKKLFYTIQLYKCFYFDSRFNLPVLYLFSNVSMYAIA